MSPEQTVPQPTGPESVVGRGRIFELVQQNYAMGSKILTFEIARRAPGVRAIVRRDDGAYLLIKEYRVELQGFDVRLPGGKVADSLEEWHKLKAETPSETEIAKQAAAREVAEETGLVDLSSFSYVDIAHCGATVVWDLYYFSATAPSSARLRNDGQEQGEVIEPYWSSAVDTLKAVLSGEMREHRSASVLATYLRRSESVHTWEAALRQPR